MKKIMYGNSLLLFGIFCFLVSFFGEHQIIDVVGLLSAGVGIIVSTIGFFSKDK